MVSGNAGHSAESLTLNLGSLKSGSDFEQTQVPLDAAVDDLILWLPDPDGCVGFFATAKPRNEYEDYYSDDEPPLPVSTGLAKKLTANGGTLVEPGKPLCWYGIDSTSCSEVVLFAVYAEDEKQPTVFRRDIEDMGFGGNVYKYVKLNKEDKELVAARKYFPATLLPWLQTGARDDSALSQSIAFSMEDEFSIAESRSVLTVHIDPQGDDLHISCTSMAGNLLCTIDVTRHDIVAKLQSCLCGKLQWASVNLWDGSEKVSESSPLSKFSVLTAEQAVAVERVSGCYQRHEHTVRPAGYSASATSLADMLVLEPRKAGLQCYFKGDYKRAEELRKLVMADARWTIELCKGEPVVRIVGKARLSRFWVHERSGPEGLELNGYECYALVTIPLEQLEQAQSEEYHYECTAGSGWTCGSENYKCSLFFPMCLLNALRAKHNGEDDAFALRPELNKDGSPEYPYNLMSASNRRMRGRSEVLKVTRKTVDMIKYFRERLAGKDQVDADEIIQLQASMPQSLPGGVSDA